MWWECLWGSVQDFGNESVVLDEGVIVERLRPFDPEFDKRQRNPVVEFLDNSGLAENDLVQDDVVRVPVGCVLVTPLLVVITE